MTNKKDEADRLAHADMRERIKAFAERVRPNYDARPVSKTEWDEACGDDFDRLSNRRIELDDENDDS